MSGVLNARSIAIIGTSDDLSKVGGQVVYLLRRGSFPSPVFPVNPHREEVQGLSCHPFIKAITELVDRCIAAVTASDVKTQIQEFLEAGARGLIVLFSSYTEHGVDGAWMDLEATNLMAPKATCTIREKPCVAETKTAEYFAAEAGCKTSQTAVITHGGYGYAEEFHVERLMREAMLSRLAPVSPQLIKCFVAEKVPGLPRSYCFKPCGRQDFRQ